MRAAAYGLGVKLMPWQERVATVATEMDDAGNSAYREVIVTIPRQSGKTTLLLLLELERAIFRARTHGEQRIFYSAQTGFDARRKLVDDQVPMIERSSLKRMVQTVRRAQGSEGVVFKTGSRIDVLASSKSAGHGRTMDLGVIDEAFDDVDDRREQAMIPAMATKPDAQLFVVSTAGTDASVYLNRKVEAGRAAVSEGMNRGVAFFEWSADEDDEPDDEDAWFRFMPALGETINVDAVRHARQSMSEGEFRRAYMNQPTSTSTDDRVIPKQIWDLVVDPRVQPDGGLVFAIDVGPSRESAAIAVADNSRRAEVVEHRPGTSWLVARTRELCDRWGARVVVDRQSAAGSFVAELDDVVDVWGTDEVAAACGRFFDRVMDGDVTIRDHEGLNAAVAGAARRNVGDRWLWGRRTSQTDITPLVAVTLALGARYEEQGAPVVSFA